MVVKWIKIFLMAIKMKVQISLLTDLDAPSSSLMDSIASPKVKTMKENELGALPDLQHFGGKREC
jgi:hypothetical protein